jgi:hypothetical protein
MSVPLWPSELPTSPLVNGYNRSLTDTRLRTSNQSGAEKVRNRYTAAVENIMEPYVLTVEQKEALETFYKSTLKNGALRFVKKEPESGNDREYRFVNPLSFVKAGPYYTTTLSLEIMP